MVSVVFIVLEELVGTTHHRQLESLRSYSGPEAVTRERVGDVFEVPRHQIVDSMSGSNGDVDGIG